MATLVRCAIVMMLCTALGGCSKYGIFGKPSLSNPRGGYARVERTMLPPHTKFEAKDDTVIHVKKGPII